MYFFEKKICADVVFKFCRYAQARINRGRVCANHCESKGPNVAKPQSFRKWQTIDIFLDIKRNQRNFLILKFGLYYLLGRKQAKSDYFSETGITNKAFSLDPLFFLRAF